MIKVDRLARALDSSTPPDIIAELKAKKNKQGNPMIRPEVTCKAEMTRRELQHYEDRVRWY